MRRYRLQLLLSRYLPIYYGWAVLAAVCCAAFSRQGPALATLSVFIEPMTTEFGWSRTALSGAVSLGGVLAAFLSPIIGRQLDRHGAQAILALAVLVTSVSVAMLSLVQSLLIFYILFCIARLTFAGPYDLGIYGAVNNWFVVRRAQAASIATLGQTFGLIAMPLIAQAAIDGAGWRSGWLVIGFTVLVVGFVPNWLLMVRRPEDLGLEPDQYPADAVSGPAVLEPLFTRAAAIRTITFWLLSLFTLFLYPVQAGVSLHQAPYLIESGMDAGVAATVVSTYSAGSAIGSLLIGMGSLRLGMRLTLTTIALCMGIGTIVMLGVSTPVQAFIAAGLFGLGNGGLATILPIAWAEYFGRRSYGAIRGVALTIQVTAQAAGPILSGMLRDWSGDYALSLTVSAVLALSAAPVAFFMRKPKRG